VRRGLAAARGEERGGDGERGGRGGDGLEVAEAGHGRERRRAGYTRAVRRAVAICALLSVGPFGCSLFGRFTDRWAKAEVGAGARPRGSRGAGSAAGDGASAAAGGASVPETTAIDRIVVRWHAPETGGVAKPQFIFARELAFEARVESLADPDPDGATFRDRHVRAALDRHIAETLLAALPTLPEPKAQEIAARAESARAMLEQRVGGRGRLVDAAANEGISSDELDAMLRRQAKASLYLDRMVTPMLEPSELELLALHRSGATPFSDRPFEDVKELMQRWYVSVRLGQALDTYYQNARSRVSLVTVKKP